MDKHEMDFSFYEQGQCLHVSLEGGKKLNHFFLKLLAWDHLGWVLQKFTEKERFLFIWVLASLVWCILEP